jgi:hypothetical protein
MDTGPAAGRLIDRGVSSVQFLLASALCLLLFVAFANLVVVQYGRGAVRSALEQGARAGAITASPVECERVAVEVTRQLLGGRMSDNLVVTCDLLGATISATGAVAFQSWTPFTPDFDVAITTRAALEARP